jgi:hypothetical protein|tara:strand:+ start:2294 stop:2419 length:126 start_codon:yes stop_codon:yes gene_type:complete
MAMKKYGVVEGETAENIIKTASDEVVENIVLADKKESSSDE